MVPVRLLVVLVWIHFLSSRSRQRWCPQQERSSPPESLQAATRVEEDEVEGHVGRCSLVTLHMRSAVGTRRCFGVRKVGDARRHDDTYFESQHRVDVVTLHTLDSVLVLTCSLFFQDKLLLFGVQCLSTYAQPLRSITTLPCSSPLSIFSNVSVSLSIGCTVKCVLTIPLFAHVSNCLSCSQPRTHLAAIFNVSIASFRLPTALPTIFNSETSMVAGFAVAMGTRAPSGTPTQTRTPLNLRKLTPWA